MKIHPTNSGNLMVRRNPKALRLRETVSDLVLLSNREAAHLLRRAPYTNFNLYTP
jgi:hypothetical protein